ncbi:MAG: hypothetical protein J6A61_03385 [Clostridia bacterium]|nr:hypothetical protein [Clostridia bacterium]
MALLLYIHESGEVRFAYGTSESEMAELYPGTVVLRHVGGDPLMPGTEGQSIEFWGND